MYAEACRAVGRFVPGGRRAVKEVGYHLERDADQWALRTHDRFALAGAILKAADSAQPATTPACAPLAGTTGIEERLIELVDEPRGRLLPRPILRGVGAVAVVVTLAVLASVPAAIAAGLRLTPVASAHVCPR